jgi:hypothetical protein
MGNAPYPRAPGGPEWSFWFDTYAPPTPWSLSRQPRRIRAGWKKALAGLGAAGGTAVTGWGLLIHPLATERTTAVILGTASGAWMIRGFRWWEDFGFNRSVVKPLASRMAAVHGMPARDWRSWLTVPPDFLTRDDGLVAESGVPPDFTGHERDMEDLARAVSVSTGIESPAPEKILKSHNPRLKWYRSDPPPDEVTWEEVEKAIREAEPHQFIIGLGKKKKLVKASISDDSPHFGIFMGSGAGKSNLATFWMLQALLRGWIVLVLDAKFFSYPWAFKDMDAEFDLLPNVRYCRRTQDLHNAMAWLGDEFARRTMKAERHIDADGHVHANVGPKMLIICEEMNLAEGRLKDYWAAERALDKELPKKSPAFQGLGAVAFGGRAVDMHLVLIGQQGTAAALGGGAIRENVGVKCLSRYSPQSWKMQCGDVAMPPAPWTPGRVQAVAGGEISETQTPWLLKNPEMNGERIRKLALSGVVTECPAGMPGGGNAPLATVVGQGTEPAHAGAEQGSVIGPDIDALPSGRGPEPLMTIAEALAEGLFVSRDAALQARQRYLKNKVVERDPKGFKYKRSDIYALVRSRRISDSE